MTAKLLISLSIIRFRDPREKVRPWGNLMAVAFDGKPTCQVQRSTLKHHMISINLMCQQNNSLLCSLQFFTHPHTTNPKQKALLMTWGSLRNGHLLNRGGILFDRHSVKGLSEFDCSFHKDGMRNLKSSTKEEGVNLKVIYFQLMRAQL